jgi:hypothetical protein
MPNNKKYTQRVQDMAEKLAIDDYKDKTTSFFEGNTWESLGDHGKEVTIFSYLNIAKVTVATQAEAIRDVCNAITKMIGVPFDPTVFLEESGYVPEPEAGSDDSDKSNT